MQQTKLRILLVLLTATAVTSALAQSKLPQEIEIVTTGNHTPMNLLRRQHEEIEIKIDGHIDE
ncbi:MAG: hypothetical protein DRQ63_12180, partial [Gammaproteobacteria bacterium]